MIRFRAYLRDGLRGPAKISFEYVMQMGIKGSFPFCLWRCRHVEIRRYWMRSAMEQPR